MKVKQLERYVVYLITLVLAIAVILLALKDPEAPPNGLKGRLDTIDTALGKLDGKLDGVKTDVADAADDVVSRVGELISAHGEETATALNGVNEVVAGTIKDSLAGLEGRVADAVFEKLRAAGCAAVLEKDCPEPPCPPCPQPPADGQWKYALLYENARLAENGELTRDSVGVKLVPRHLKRLDALAEALESCDREDAPVTLDVTGYASTAEFRSPLGGERMKNSDVLNLKTANLRRQIVADYLRAKGFDLVPQKPWSLEHPIQHPYEDDGLWALNRAVHITLTSAGACSLPQ